MKEPQEGIRQTETTAMHANSKRSTSNFLLNRIQCKNVKYDPTLVSLQNKIFLQCPGSGATGNIFFVISIL